MKKLKFIVLLIIMLALANAVQAVVIKMGTIAPLRSPWVDEIRALDQEWRKITGGKVEIKIFAGGIAGNEEDMVRKIKMGILGGAVFTNIGITQIYPDAYVLNMPFAMDSDAELDYVLKKLTPGFEKEIEKKGFTVLTWAKSGWLYFFSKRPIIYPEDLKKHKLSFATGTPEMEQSWKKSGYHVIPTDLKDLLMALQSGMLDAAYLPALLAASGQYFPLIPNMSPLKVAPLVGGIVVSNQVWAQVPDQYKKEMIAAAQRVAADLFQKTDKLEKDALDMMKKHGLIINKVPPDAPAKWKAETAKGLDELIGKAFSKDVYDKLIQALNEFRKKK
ncbi:MAG: TRAP transporter substrate-binding protein DctP [Candidatus Omnitrophota bacterium]